jgi:NADP-dependent 3-hydroxy acid dehydrogenase YdfG
MSTLLADKIILVACNTSVVGAGIVRTFLLADATVIFPANSSQAITMLKEQMGDINTSKLVTLLTDYPDYNKAFEIVEAIIERFGKIDICVICFDAPTTTKGLTETDIMTWEKMIDQNITAVFVGAQIVLSRMKENKQGMFINIINMDSSENGTFLSLAGLSAAMQAEMIKVLYKEVKRFNVRCHNLFIINLKATEIHGTRTEEKKQINPDAIANYIANLYNGQVADSESLFQWLPGKPETFDINAQ